MLSKKEIEKRRLEFDRSVCGELAKFTLDVIKLLIGGVILVSIVDVTNDRLLLILATILLSIGLLIVWFVLYKESKYKL